jgi:hypothetical protein
MNILKDVQWSSNSLWKVYSNSTLPGGRKILVLRVLKAFLFLPPRK